MKMLLMIVFSAVSAHGAMNFEPMDQMRKNCRQSIIENSLEASYKSGFKPGDLAEQLVEDPSKMIRNIKMMDEKKLNNAKLKIAPWSDSYWPIFLGTIGNRYNDPDFAFGDWKEAFDYITQNPAAKLIQEKKFDMLAPAEKYDFLFQLKDEGLTQTSWNEGKSYYDSNGSVETWMGLCHGWAAASINTPEPKKTVTVQSNEGEFSFFASDIKALTTLLWSKGRFRTRFVGGRCNEKNPPTDHMGRPTSEDCLDNNPGTWHMAIVNQIGIFKRSFVMDATYDYEVWNQPVTGYKIKYYNPTTKNDTTTLNEAIVLRSDFKKDPRAKLRADLSTHLVGVKMLVSYTVENSPNANPYQETYIREVEYEYDLELDKNLNIVGGEWYSDNHPDFLWVPDKNAFPLSAGDQTGKSIDLKLIDNETISLAKTNAMYELPYGAIVRALVGESQDIR
jgi:hypothetical protein